jgi:hypothetical protein
MGSEHSRSDEGDKTARTSYSEITVGQVCVFVCDHFKLTKLQPKCFLGESQHSPREPSVKWCVRKLVNQLKRSPLDPMHRPQRTPEPMVDQHHTVRMRSTCVHEADLGAGASSKQMKTIGTGRTASTISAHVPMSKRWSIQLETCNMTQSANKCLVQ